MVVKRIRESPPKSTKHSGLGIVLMCPESCWLRGGIVMEFDTGYCPWSRYFDPSLSLKKRWFSWRLCGEADNVKIHHLLHESMLRLRDSASLYCRTLRIIPMIFFEVDENSREPHSDSTSVKLQILKAHKITKWRERMVDQGSSKMTPTPNFMHYYYKENPSKLP